MESGLFVKPIPQEPIRVTSSHFARTGICVAACLLAVTGSFAKPQDPAGNASFQGVVQGYVRDSAGRPLPNATVSLQLATGTETLASPTQITRTDSAGAYHFAGLREGVYTLRAEMSGYGRAIAGPLSLAQKETKKIDLALVSTKASEPQSAPAGASATGKPAAQAPEFFDEPQFTVAGVTQATNSGGHGSDTVLRTTEALARATVSLSNESAASSPAPASAAAEGALRDAAARVPESFEANRQLGEFLAVDGKSAEALGYLERASQLNPENPELHHALGDIEEKLGNPLQAVREYQRAAELDSSELYLFDWGTELLTHRALEPATQVFAKGNRLFPKSLRMLVALGVAWYARGSYDQATQCLANASDLAPDNPAPYLFLGRMQSVETTPSAESVERLARFARVQPDNALANYYYAVSLSKEPAHDSASVADGDRERSARVESLLQKAVHLDPKLGAAYLQLGIFYSRRADFSQAIAAYQKAIEVSREQASPQFANPQLEETLEEAHYRLAQAYLRTGFRTKAQEQLQLHNQLAKKTKEDTERGRREIQEFVISLRK